jgi:hypothetical protein
MADRSAAAGIALRAAAGLVGRIGMTTVTP